MKLSELCLHARRALLVKEDPDTASFLARNLVCHVTGKSPAQFLADKECNATFDQYRQVDNGVMRLLAGEPLAYVLGEWDFYGMRLTVNKNVLIPRDDTCAVVELAINTGANLPENARVLDLCTGSGCIGLAIAKHVKHVKVTLADISEDALAVARKNVASQKLGAKVSCVQADALGAPSAFLGKFDMIVSNPPYITSREMLELPDSVGRYEPRLALYGGQDGLDFYRAIVENYSQALKPGGYLCFEFGMGQGDAVCEILQNHGYTILERSRDYNDRERAVLAQLGRKED